MVLMMGPELILYHVRGTDCVEKKKLKAKRKAERYFHGYIITERIIFFIVFHNFSLFKCFIQQAEDNVQDTPPHSILIDYTRHKPSLLTNF